MNEKQCKNKNCQHYKNRNDKMIFYQFCSICTIYDENEDEKDKKIVKPRTYAEFFEREKRDFYPIGYPHPVPPRPKKEEKEDE